MLSLRSLVAILVLLPFAMVAAETDTAKQQRIDLLVESVDSVLCDVELECILESTRSKEQYKMGRSRGVYYIQEQYDRLLKRLKRYKKEGRKTDSIQDSLRAVHQDLREAQERLAEAEALQGVFVAQRRKIRISVANSIMRVHHIVEPSPANEEVLAHTRQIESGKMYELFERPARPQLPRNVIITDNHYRWNPFRTTTTLTFGRGISYYIGAPMNLVPNEEEPGCYSLTVWNSERSDIVGRFVLDPSKGFCWKRAEIYEAHINEGTGEPTIVAECSDFRESAGVFLPFHCVYEYYHYSEKQNEEPKLKLISRRTYDVTAFSAAASEWIARDLSAEKLIQPDDIVIRPAPAGER